MKKVFLVGLALSCIVASSAFANPVLVVQPDGRTQFFVQATSILPANWYLTYDNRPAAKTSEGVWVYGIVSGNAVIPTTYIVGATPLNVLAAIPIVSTPVVGNTVQHVQIVPLFPNTGAPVVMERSAFENMQKNIGGQQSRNNAGKQSGQTPSAPQTIAPVTVHVPEWLSVPAFMSMGAWKHVDRMGLLEKPRTPVAWGGDSPDTLFVWTGKSWFQMRVGENENISDVLKNNLYSIVRMANNNHFKWNDEETPVLANQAAVWGKTWVGRIAPSNLR